MFPNCWCRKFGVWVEWTVFLGILDLMRLCVKKKKVFLEIQSTHFTYLLLRTQVSTFCQQSNSSKIVIEGGKNQIPLSLCLMLRFPELFQAIPMDWPPWPVITHKNSCVEWYHTQCRHQQQMVSSVTKNLLQSSSRYLVRLISLFSCQVFPFPLLGSQ